MVHRRVYPVLTTILLLANIFVYASIIHAQTLPQQVPLPNPAAPPASCTSGQGTCSSHTDCITLDCQGDPVDLNGNGVWDTHIDLNSDGEGYGDANPANGNACPGSAFDPSEWKDYGCWDNNVGDSCSCQLLCGAVTVLDGGCPLASHGEYCEEGYYCGNEAGGCGCFLIPQPTFDRCEDPEAPCPLILRDNGELEVNDIVYLEVLNERGDTTAVTELLVELYDPEADKTFEVPIVSRGGLLAFNAGVDEFFTEPLYLDLKSIVEDQKLWDRDLELTVELRLHDCCCDLNEIGPDECDPTDKRICSDMLCDYHVGTHTIEIVPVRPPETNPFLASYSSLASGTDLSKRLKSEPDRPSCGCENITIVTKNRGIVTGRPPVPSAPFAHAPLRVGKMFFLEAFGLIPNQRGLGLKAGDVLVGNGGIPKLRKIIVTHPDTNERTQHIIDTTLSHGFEAHVYYTEGSNPSACLHGQAIKVETSYKYDNNEDGAVDLTRVVYSKASRYKMLGEMAKAGDLSFDSFNVRPEFYNDLHNTERLPAPDYSGSDQLILETGDDFVHWYDSMTNGFDISKTTEIRDLNEIRIRVVPSPGLNYKTLVREDARWLWSLFNPVISEVAPNPTIISTSSPTPVTVPLCECVIQYQNSFTTTGGLDGATVNSSVVVDSSHPNNVNCYAINNPTTW